MKAMKANEIREMEPAVIHAEVEKIRRQLLELRFKVELGEEVRPTQLRGLKRDMARYLTVLREKELQA